MANEHKCRIWATPAELKSTSDYQNVAIISSSRAGGDYIITNMAEFQIDGLDNDGFLKLTTWIVDQIRCGESPANVTPEVVESIIH